MFKVWSFVHNLFQFGAMINCLMKQALQHLLQKEYVTFCVFRTVTCLSHPTDKCLFNVKSRITIITYWLWSKSTIKTPEQYHVVFSFNFEHNQQINLIFSLLILNMYLSFGHRIIFTKQIKCILSNRVSSLKHVHVVWVSQHVLNNQ